jgi:integrase
MASIYQRNGSPFWWIKYRDPRSGKVTRESTGFKVGVGADTRRARNLSAEKTLAEARHVQSVEGEQWEFWVMDFLKARYGASAATLTRYSTIWRNLKMFIDEMKILSPRALTREHCLKFLAWRADSDRGNGKYKACRNTAILELKIFGVILAEAVRRGFAPFNPCRDLDISREKAKVKPEMTDDDYDAIEVAIAKEPKNDVTEFLAHSFRIARYQGCRLNETHLNPMKQVDLKNLEITFFAKQGKTHTAPLHPKLVPLFKDLIDAGRTETFVKPPNPSRKWFDFLKRIGMRKRLPGACFHSTRVTAATRLARNNVPENKAMRYLGHASTTVHRIYVRLKTGDLGDCLSALD